MSITRSYNKHNGVTYAYETTYEWSEEKQKYIQKKHCIGHFVPGTNNIVPNGPRGKQSQYGTPVILDDNPDYESSPTYAKTIQSLDQLRIKLETFEHRLADLSSATQDIVSVLVEQSGKK